MHSVIDAGQDKDAYDKGPIIFQFPVFIRPDETAETLAKRVNEKERAWQAFILNKVVHRRIWLEGKGPDDWEVFHTCPELAQFIPGRLVPDGAEIHYSPQTIQLGLGGIGREINRYEDEQKLKSR